MTFDLDIEQRVILDRALTMLIEHLAELQREAPYSGIIERDLEYARKLRRLLCRLAPDQ